MSKADERVDGDTATMNEEQKKLYDDLGRVLDILEEPDEAERRPVSAPAKARQRTEKELRDTLKMLCEMVWNGGRPPKGQHVWSIPVDKDRDFDIILADAIDELIERRADATKAASGDETLEQRCYGFLEDNSIVLRKMAKMLARFIRRQPEWWADATGAAPPAPDPVAGFDEIVGAGKGQGGVAELLAERNGAPPAPKGGEASAEQTTKPRGVGGSAESTSAIAGGSASGDQHAQEPSVPSATAALDEALTAVMKLPQRVPRDWSASELQRRNYPFVRYSAVVEILQRARRRSDRPERKEPTMSDDCNCGFPHGDERGLTIATDDQRDARADLARRMALEKRQAQHLAQNAALADEIESIPIHDPLPGYKAQHIRIHLARRHAILTALRQAQPTTSSALAEFANKIERLPYTTGTAQEYYDCFIKPLQAEAAALRRAAEQ